ncbi:cathepsin B-like [Leguminivora glycinivorella]|uniref:cathepsin B-like n=1 Tax=Leguminivora glycinivorella TaxID=1035111 RepID=UPI00200C2226|nr:cathepsin B-like [Leguminivora glycinivorella]
MTLSIAILLLTVATLATAENAFHPLSDEFISLINSKQSTWKAGRNFHLDTPLTYIKGLMGIRKGSSTPEIPVQFHDDDLIANLPENFDVRDKWPNCPSLNEIGDQGSCGNDCAFAVTGVMTDRVCIDSNESKHFQFSAQDMTSCSFHSDCMGGYLDIAFSELLYVGIVSGGFYNSSQGCKPYEIPPCEHHVDGNRPTCNESSDTPLCVKKCVAGYNVEYDKDLHYAKLIYKLNGEDQIKAELYKNGPVASSFVGYEDFVNYKSGVYSHTAGDVLGDHAVKILGWGVENGKKYWLCANSWNSDWGEKGFFKILRGENHCYIEDEVYAGKPDLRGL